MFDEFISTTLRYSESCTFYGFRFKFHFLLFWCTWDSLFSYRKQKQNIKIRFHDRNNTFQDWMCSDFGLAFELLLMHVSLYRIYIRWLLSQPIHAKLLEKSKQKITRTPMLWRNESSLSNDASAVCSKEVPVEELRYSKDELKCLQQNHAKHHEICSNISMVVCSSIMQNNHRRNERMITTFWNR